MASTPVTSYPLLINMFTRYGARGHSLAELKRGQNLPPPLPMIGRGSERGGEGGGGRGFSPVTSMSLKSASGFGLRCRSPEPSSIPESCTSAKCSSSAPPIWSDAAPAEGPPSHPESPALFGGIITPLLQPASQSLALCLPFFPQMASSPSALCLAWNIASQIVVPPTSNLND